mmetsp:Transcript_4891/g.8559  ORF Transcript_4891/g.8559 Transcript_4891/m.8559 type:complete len:262 (+) Transcript_4891:31-816(+)
MGRRHFALQPSLHFGADAGIDFNTASEHLCRQESRGRRQFRIRPGEGDGTDDSKKYGGGIPSALFEGIGNSSRRHFDGVPSKEEKKPERRHYSNDVLERFDDLPSGRKHVIPPKSHFIGTSAVVIPEERRPLSKRPASASGRLCSDREQSLPPQRRHFAKDDHFMGAIALQADCSPWLGPRKAASPWQTARETMGMVVKWEPELKPARPSRRPLTAPGSVSAGNSRRCVESQRRGRGFAPFRHDSDLTSVLQYRVVREPPN